MAVVLPAASVEQYSSTSFAFWRHVKAGEIEVLTTLLNRPASSPAAGDQAASNANANLSDAFGIRVLHWAVYLGYDAIVRLLVAHGAEIDAVDGDGQTALHIALSQSEQHPGLPELLLSLGASLDTTDPNGATPLHLACSLPKADTDTDDITLLWDKGAQPDAFDHQGLAPLHCAVFHGRRAATKFLLSSFADRLTLSEWLNGKTRDEHGHTPLMLAIVRGNEPVARLLLHWYSAVNSLSHEEAAVPDFEVCDAEGSTALHLALRFKQLSLAKDMIKLGASAATRNAAGESAQSIIEQMAPSLQATNPRYGRHNVATVRSHHSRRSDRKGNNASSGSGGHSSSNNKTVHASLRHSKPSSRPTTTALQLNFEPLAVQPVSSIDLLRSMGATSPSSSSLASPTSPPSPRLTPSPQLPFSSSPRPHSSSSPRRPSSPRLSSPRQVVSPRLSPSHFSPSTSFTAPASPSVSPSPSSSSFSPTPSVEPPSAPSGAVFVDSPVPPPPLLDHLRSFHQNLSSLLLSSGRPQETVLQEQHAALLNDLSARKSTLSELEQVVHARLASVEQQLAAYHCLVCRVQPADHILLPCGHLCCCARCAPIQSHCPRCSNALAGVVRFIS